MKTTAGSIASKVNYDNESYKKLLIWTKCVSIRDLFSAAF